ncbi:hypothetical protein G6L41_008605 [Agrobacterium tumefaciens]|uniref:GT99 family glycosyltransferase N-terminal domain-containing protein n=1 Tax=Agrobacterium tumefaciens TaxID=358 RepID=UPI001572A633|nr:hypothetical protein [Agrobacterium tumefaciens]WCK12329.1 hypothetical protein G6L41_008605 [Agrobacterium tumefaciens]
MHFVFVVPPVSATGHETYYFWVLQKWLHETRDKNTTIIMPEAYATAFGDNTRWELSEQSINFNQFFPSSSIGPNADVILYPPPSASLADRPPATEFVELIGQEIPALKQFYIEALREIKEKAGEPVAVITWLNNASLRSASHSEDCPLVFNEFGPFRKPYYRPTAYWDRQGVNGETEVEKRWSAEKAEFTEWRNSNYPEGGSTEDLRTLMADPLSMQIITRSEPQTKIGLALQVETDSNALAYGRGWNNLSLISHAKRSAETETALLRLHPGGAAIYPGKIDLRPSPLEFLANVDEVWTVNSSLGIEAFFWGKNARVFGESPIKPIESLPTGEREVFLDWFILCYLIPFDLLFDFDYYAWRLTSPLPSEIARRHADAYRSGPKQEWGAVPFPPTADRRNLSVDFPGPQRAPVEFAELKVETVEQRQYIAKLEKDFQGEPSILEERKLLLTEQNKLLSDMDALTIERDKLLRERSRMLGELRILTSEKTKAIAKYDLATREIETIKSSIPFRILKRLRILR